MTRYGNATKVAQGESGTRLRPTVHRITTSTAAVANDPTREELAGLLAEVERSGRGSFVVAQCRAGQPTETYLQAVHGREGWTLEAREVGASVTVRVIVADIAVVEDVFAWWTLDLPAWRALAWQPVMRDRQWLTHD